jgi:DNA ligase-associated metallophosphoesterase
MTDPAATMAPATGPVGATFAGLLLLAQRAAWHAPTSTLFVADVHLGKAAAFVQLGSPLPGAIASATTARDLARLTDLLALTGAQRLIVLGDLLHAPQSKDQHTMDQLRAWRRAHAQLSAVLIRGNHDDRAGDPPADCAFTCLSAHASLPDLPGLLLAHYPPGSPAPGQALTLCGHLHPVLHLPGPGYHRERAPCFWHQHAARALVLPAFGSFTGGHRAQPQIGDTLWPIGDGQVVALAR